MKKILTLAFMLMISASCFGQGQVCDDLESLAIGSLNPSEVSGTGITWLSLDGTVVDVGGDLQINQVNTFMDGILFAEIQADLSTANLAVSADVGFTVSVDYTLSDLNTDRFFTPVDDVVGIIFTRCGDQDGDGDWDVLETDSTGAPVWIDTGVAVPLAGTIEFNVLDLALEISVNSVNIYTGSIIGALGGVDVDGDGNPDNGENLDLFDFESANNVDGGGSEININNLAVNSSCSVADGCAVPSTFTRFRGINVGTPSVDDFAGSDGSAASFNPGFTLNNVEAPVWLIFDYPSAASGGVELTSSAGTPGLTLTVEYWDGSAYQVIGTAAESFNSFTTESFSLNGASTDRIRVGWRRTSFTVNFPWQVNVDAVDLCQ